MTFAPWLGTRRRWRSTPKASFLPSKRRLIKQATPPRPYRSATGTMSPKSKGGFGEGARRGWADAWYKGHFVWEYKGLDGANLDAAYQQLLLYKDSLGNPPLLITSDTQDIFIHTNFTNTVKRIHKVTFDSRLEGSGLALLKRAFDEPESFKPSETQEQVTRATAEHFSRVADTLQTWAKLEGERIDPEQLAHFIIRLLFCLFAEDIKLLPAGIFTSLVKQSYTEDEIETLDYIHTALDHAVLDAYGWPHNLSEEQILERLLGLNLERAKG